MINPTHHKIIINALEKKAHSLGRATAWFQYVKKQKSEGYRFLAHKGAQMRVLEDVMHSLQGKLPGMTEGEVADFIAQTVNNE